MAGLRYKISGEAVFASAHDEKRFDALVAKVRAYEKDVSVPTLLTAFLWTRRRYNRRLGMPPVAHDALEVTTRMAELAHAGSDTLIGAILSPAMQPTLNGDIVESDFGEVRALFGQEAHDTVCARLSLLQIQYRPLATISKSGPRRLSGNELKQYQDEQAARQKRHLHDFRHMALFATAKYVKKMPPAILIGGVEYLLALENIGKVRDPALRDDLLLKIKDIYADMVGIAGFRNVQEALMDEWLRFKEPKLYLQIQEVRNEQIGNGHAKKQQAVEFKKARMTEAMSQAGFALSNYTIETHLKTPWSIYKKMREKNINIADLPLHIRDFVQASIVIDTEDCQKTHTSRNMRGEYALCTRAHQALTAKFRQAKGPYKDHKNPRLFILKDGRRVDSIDFVPPDQVRMEPRFKDYMKVPNKAEQANIDNDVYTPVYGPKRNGYAAMHDTVVIGDGEVDVHITTKEREDNHRYGTSAHGAFKGGEYKSEAAADQPLVDWYHAVRGTFDGEKPALWVSGFAGDNRIVTGRHPMNLAEFGGYIGPHMVADSIGALKLAGGGPTSEGGELFPAPPKRGGDGFFPLDTEVLPGMSVQLLTAENVFLSAPHNDKIMSALKRNRPLRRQFLRYTEQLKHS